jgi:hypothetical protein
MRYAIPNNCCGPPIRTKMWSPFLFHVTNYAAARHVLGLGYAVERRPSIAATDPDPQLMGDCAEECTISSMRSLVS